MGIDLLTIRKSPGTDFLRRLSLAALSTSLICGGMAYASEPATSKVKHTPAAIVSHRTTTDPSAKIVKTSPKTAQKKKSKAQVGSASWYGEAFQGRPTASGESYDMYQYTAAHRNLPLGTWVRVTNLRNGKSLIVKVNDRGPFVDTDHRIVDVSYAAARMLEFSGKGITRVKLEVVEPETIAYAAQGSTLE